MPLKVGKSKATIKANIKELMDAYKATGKIGTSTPANARAASRQATAIAYAQAEGRPKKKRKGGK